MHTVHAGLSIAAVIKPDKIDTVNSIFKELNANPGNNSKLPFAKSPTTHLVSGLVIPEQEFHGRKFPATLMLMTSYAGPLKTHLDELVAVGASGLRELFRNCTDYTSDADSSDESLKNYIRIHRRSDTFYTGMQYITHTDIGNEEQLRIAIETYIGQQQLSGGFKDLGATAIRKKIQEFVSSKPEFAWAKQPWKKSFNDAWALWGGGIMALVGILAFFVLAIYLLCILVGTAWWLNLLMILGAIIVFVAFLLITYRINELNEKFVAPRQPDKKVYAVMSTQNHPVINEMTISGPLKYGWVHTFSFNLVLKIVALVRGILTIPTIATARWLTIDGGKRMVFISNFGNLSESYVRDFIDSKASAWKINLLFGQGHGYPGTRFLINDGCLKDSDAFLNDVHLYQQITQLWYWPYMNLSIDNINVNRSIRLNLYSNLTDAQAQDWLKLF